MRTRERIVGARGSRTEVEWGVEASLFRFYNIFIEFSKVLLLFDLWLFFHFLFWQTIRTRQAEYSIEVFTITTSLGSFSFSSAFGSTEPLIVTALPASIDQIVVLLSNPSGAAFEGYPIQWEENENDKQWRERGEEIGGRRWERREVTERIFFFFLIRVDISPLQPQELTEELNKSLN